MDTIAHVLWTWILFKLADIRFKKKLNIWLAVFFGAFPDIFSFGPALIFPTLQYLTDYLYSFSHSLIIFFIIFSIAILIKKFIFHKKSYECIPLEMLGWLIHILIDIPTHPLDFFPTPMFWPVSSFKINGFFWGDPLFLLINYIALIFALIALLKIKKRPLN